MWWYLTLSEIAMQCNILNSTYILNITNLYLPLQIKVPTFTSQPVLKTSKIISFIIISLPSELEFLGWKQFEIVKIRFALLIDRVVNFFFRYCQRSL